MDNTVPVQNAWMCTFDRGDFYLCACQKVLFLML